jgi:hypothetical protein
MKIKTLGVIAFFLFFSLFLPGDGFAKGGGGRGGGKGIGGVGRSFSRGGKLPGGLRPGHIPHAYPRPIPPSGSYYRGWGTGLFLGGYFGLGSSYYAPSGCYSCHPGLSWYDRSRNCTYSNPSSPEISEDRLVTEKDIQAWQTWRDRDPYIGP